MIDLLPDNLSSRARQRLQNTITCIYTCLLLMIMPVVAYSQAYDLLIKGGHVIDPKNNINSPMDVAVSGDSIARVAENIQESEARQIIDAGGLYVTPGLVDIHTHVFHGTELNRYLSNSYYAVPPDNFSFKYGGCGRSRMEKF